MYTKTYADLQAEYNGKNIPYRELIQTIDWRNFRDKIVKEQKHLCQKCFSKEAKAAWEYLKYQKLRVGVYLDDEGTYQYCKELVLDVHHKYYIKGKLPWEYQPDAFLAVCRPCHIKIHQETVVKVFSEIVNGTEESIIPCISCKGTGFQDEFHKDFNLTCNHCEGKGYSEAH